MMKELTLQELEGQQVELLPSRETLFLDLNWADITATNTSVAMNVGSYFSSANSLALQSVHVAQL